MTPPRLTRLHVERPWIEVKQADTHADAPPNQQARSSSFLPRPSSLVLRSSSLVPVVVLVLVLVLGLSSILRKIEERRRSSTTTTTRDERRGSGMKDERRTKRNEGRGTDDGRGSRSLN